MSHEIVQFLIICAFILGAVGYLYPGMIASTRKAKNRNFIWVMNLILGWTVLVWIASVIWACTDEIESSKED